MKMTWEDGDGIQRGFVDSSAIIKKRLMTMSTDGATRIIRDATSDDVDDFLAENEVKLVPENAVSVEPDEYARMKNLARMYADQIEAAKLEGYNACEKVYRDREEAWDAERAELVENLRATQEKLSELRKYTAGPYGLKAAHVGNLIMQCIDGGYDLEISEARTAIGRVGYKVRVDPATRTVLKADIFDAIEEMLKEVRRG